MRAINKGPNGESDRGSVATTTTETIGAGPRHAHLPLWMWIVPCLWAGAFLTGAEALKRMSADTVTFLRFAVTVGAGAFVLRGPLTATLRQRPSWKQWRAILVLALAGGVAYHVTFYAGLARTQAPIASVVIATNPILTALCAAMVFRDRRPTASLIVGLLLAFAGVLLLAMDKPLPDVGPAGFLQRLLLGWGAGESLCLLASLAWAVFAVLLQHHRAGALRSLPGVGVTYLVYAATAALMLPVVCATGHASQIVTMSWAEWGCILYIGLVATVIAYTLYNVGLDRVGSARVSQVTYAVPALTTLLTVLVDPSFRPSGLTWLGLAVVTGGLVVSDGRIAAAIRERFGD